MRQRELLAVDVQDARRRPGTRRRARIRRSHRDQEVVLRTRRPQEGGEELRQPGRDPGLLARDRRSRSSPARSDPATGRRASAGSIGATSSRAMPSWVAASCSCGPAASMIEASMWPPGAKPGIVEPSQPAALAGLREGGPTRRRELDRLRGPAQGVDVLAQPWHQPDQSDRGVAERRDGVVTGRSRRAEQVLGLIELTRLERGSSVAQVVARLREGVRGLDAGPRQIGDHQDEEDADATEYPGPDAPPASSRRSVCAVLHRVSHGTRGPARRLACGWNRR